MSTPATRSGPHAGLTSCPVQKVTTAAPSPQDLSGALAGAPAMSFQSRHRSAADFMPLCTLLCSRTQALSRHAEACLLHVSPSWIMWSLAQASSLKGRAVLTASSRQDTVSHLQAARTDRLLIFATVRGVKSDLFIFICIPWWLLGWNILKTLAPCGFVLWIPCSCSSPVFYLVGDFLDYALVFSLPFILFNGIY